jgi:hypothetical protein
MICHPCRAGEHGQCPGDTWCDCQHRVDPVAVRNRQVVAKATASAKHRKGKPREQGSTSNAR